MICSQYAGVPKPGVFWVLTPPLFGSYTPHFLEDPKKWKLERAGKIFYAVKKILGAEKIFRGCKMKGKGEKGNRVKKVKLTAKSAK